MHFKGFLMNLDHVKEMLALGTYVQLNIVAKTHIRDTDW